jgi:hypothetical protein
VKISNLNNLKSSGEAATFTQRYQILPNNDLHIAVLADTWRKFCLKKNFNKSSQDSEFLNSPLLSFLVTTALPTTTFDG